MATGGSTPIRRRKLLAAGPLAAGAAALGSGLLGTPQAVAGPARGSTGTTITGFPHLSLGRGGVVVTDGTRDLSKSYEANFSDGIWWMLHTLFLPALSHSHRGVILLNLVLDEDGGPGPSTFTNGTGLVQLDAATGSLRPNSEFYVMTHFSRFIPAGSSKLSVTTSEPRSDTLQAVAADVAASTVVVVHNNKPERRVGVRARGRTMTATLPGWSLATYVIPRR